MNRKLLYVLIIFISYFIGCWDLDGLRQGTETFYLKVAREMFDSNSYMVPLHRGSPHWSKPPFVFWLSFPFYALFSFSHHFAARLSIIFSTLFATYLFSKEVSLGSKKGWLKYFIIILTSFGFFRFGKIFMMDASLAIFTSLSLIYFYNSQVHHQSQKLYFAIIFGAISILIKGPVSLVMIGLALALYGLINPLNREKRLLKNGVFYLFCSLALSSLWFLYCYYQFGHEFIDYFFLRENVGKFESQSYPIRKLFQGLFFYSLPWSFIVFFLFPKLKQFNLKRFFQDRYSSFLFISFVAFFSIWIIPSQRSHHYALPAIPFFLAWITSFIHIRIHKFIKSFSFILIFLLFSISLLATYLLFNDIGNPSVVITFIFGLTIPFLIWQFHEDNNFYIGYLFGLSIFWSLLLPTYSLPKLPNSAVAHIGNQSLFTVFKKNYYYEQTLGRSVGNIREHLVKKHMKQNKAFYLFTKEFVDRNKLENYGVIVDEWKVWRRRVKFGKIIKSVIENKPNNIQEKYILMHSE